MWWRWLLGIALLLLYWRSPIDLLPDFLPRIGFLDDIGALALLWWYLKKKAKESVEEKIKREDEQASSSQGTESSPQQGLSPYQVLGVAPGASREEIDSAYKSLMKQYHPDRVHGLGEELQKVAREKSQAINAAYAKLTK